MSALTQDADALITQLGLQARVVATPLMSDPVAEARLRARLAVGPPRADPSVSGLRLVVAVSTGSSHGSVERRYSGPADGVCDALVALTRQAVEQHGGHPWVAEQWSACWALDCSMRRPVSERLLVREARDRWIRQERGMPDGIALDAIPGDTLVWALCETGPGEAGATVSITLTGQQPWQPLGRDWAGEARAALEPERRGWSRIPAALAAGAWVPRELADSTRKRLMELGAQAAALAGTGSWMLHLDDSGALVLG